MPVAGTVDVDFRRQEAFRCLLYCVRDNCEKNHADLARRSQALDTNAQMMMACSGVMFGVVVTVLWSNGRVSQGLGLSGVLGIVAILLLMLVLIFCGIAIKPPNLKNAHKADEEVGIIQDLRNVPETERDEESIVNHLMDHLLAWRATLIEMKTGLDAKTLHMQYAWCFLMAAIPFTVVAIGLLLKQAN